MDAFNQMTVEDNSIECEYCKGEGISPYWDFMNDNLYACQFCSGKGKAAIKMADKVRGVVIDIECKGCKGSGKISVQARDRFVDDYIEENCGLCKGWGGTYKTISVAELRELLK